MFTGQIGPSRGPRIWDRCPKRYCNKESFMNDVTALGGEVIKEFVISVLKS